MEKENKQYIETLGELRKHFGEILIFYYYKGEKQDKPYFMWMGKLMQVNKQPYDKDDNLVRGKHLRVENMIAIGDCYGLIQKPPYALDGIYCDAQSVVRIPTKEEMKTYMNFFRHKRIFGVNNHTEVKKI